MKASIRKAKSEDITAIVKLHAEAFSGFFLSLMGAPFLRELYTGFLEDDLSICLVSIEGEKVTGFVVGTTHPEKFFRSLLRSRWCYFGVRAVPGLMRHPILVAQRVWTALSYRGEAPRRLNSGALLSSIGISPQSAGQGIGRLLVEQFCEIAATKGARNVFLTTDRDNNEAVNGFYLKLGFTLEDSFLKHGTRHMNRYVRIITAPITGELDNSERNLVEPRFTNEYFRER